RTLCSIFQKNSTNSSPKILPEPFQEISAEEPIARFLFSSSNFNKQKVKYGAFMPAPNGDASVIRIFQLEEKEIQLIDTTVVSKTRKDVSKGRAEFIAMDAFELDLKIEPDTKTHPRHANLTNYSSEKSKTRSQAQQLAERSKLILRS
ncbi:MAG: hypothetical protein V4591_01515, partial [Bdellovibrionota bacterium]